MDKLNELKRAAAAEGWDNPESVLAYSHALNRSKHKKIKIYDPGCTFCETVVLAECHYCDKLSCHDHMHYRYDPGIIEEVWACWTCNKKLSSSSQWNKNENILGPCPECSTMESKEVIRCSGCGKHFCVSHLNLGKFGKECESCGPQYIGFG